MGTFYPSDIRPAKMLRWYAERFDTVEINNSFYRLPAPAAFQIWCRGTRLGPILFQLPPSWKVNAQRLEGFLATLPSTHRYLFEFRNPTWNVGPAYQVLERRNAAFCIYELAGFQSPVEVTADFTYVRLHGPGNQYQGITARSENSLRSWAKMIEVGRTELEHAFVYFDNDQAGFAAKNALQLKRLVDG